jgi:hypothetical protein
MKTIFSLTVICGALLAQFGSAQQPNDYGFTLSQYTGKELTVHIPHGGIAVFTRDCYGSSLKAEYKDGATPNKVALFLAELSMDNEATHLSYEINVKQ